MSSTPEDWPPRDGRGTTGNGSSPPRELDAQINDVVDSDMSVSETASLKSAADGVDGPRGTTEDTLEKNKSSLKLIRRRRNIGSSGITKEFWMRDDKVKECYECKQSFTTFRRKHHCRICGQIFCHRCASSIVPGERFGYPGEMRVCNFCMKIMDDYKDDEPQPPDYPAASSIPISFGGSLKRHPASPATATSKSLATPVHGSLPTSPGHLPWPLSPSPEGSFEGFKKMLGSSLFNNRRVTASDETLADAVKASEPFRGSADHNQRAPGESIVDLIDPEIAAYMTDDENEDDPADHWATSPFLNFPPNAETADSANDHISTRLPATIPGVNITLATPTDSDTWDYGGGKERKRRVHRRISRNDELRLEFSKEKIKRRTLSSGHPRPTKFSARAISRQISKSTLASPPGGSVASLDEASALSVSQTSQHVRTESNPPSVELNAASLEHMRRLLRQVLSESEMGASSGWEDVLMSIMLKACDSIQPDVRGGDFIDIRHYVKIKKIPGGLPSDSEYVCGVVCSKNVAHKKMLRTISQPKIMLLTFALEYQRVENQFLSLEPLLSQEREHLKILVSRVVALQPDIVLVEKTVSRLALEYFLESNVAVAYNVKPSVIEAIARCTRADIIASVDKLALEPKLGNCETFSIKTFMNDQIPGYRRTYLFFSGCPKELGCTIVLRGGTRAQLAKIKQIADLMAFVVYNLKLETFLFRDQFAMEPSTEQGQSGQLLLEGVTDSGAVQKRAAEVTPFTRAIRPYEETILSASPHVKFPLPYLLMRLKEEEQQMANPGKKSSADKAKLETKKDLESTASEGGDERDYIRSILDQSGGWLASIETRAGINNLLENASSLSPFGHQSIVVLYSNVCAATSIPCQPPEQHTIEYYRGTDMTLGQYLEELCSNAELLCPAKLCDRKMLMHFRSYAHGQGRVNVVIEEFAAPVQGMEDVILMWSFCKSCNQVTPVVPMSEETWKYSFGKYLELSYYHTRLSCRAAMCPHDIFRDHIRYFSLKNLAVRFEYEMIELLEVVVPPKRLRFVTEIRAKLKQHDYEALNTQIIDYYDSLAERMKMFTFDIVPPSKVQTAKEAMSEMSKRAASEKKYVLQLLQQTLVSSAATDILAFNGPLRVLQEKVVQWEVDFTTFVRRFLQPDPKEIRRSTAAQLKRMFADKEIAGQRSGIPALPADSAPLEIEMGLNPTTIDASLPALGRSPTSATSQLFAKAISSRSETRPVATSQARVNRRMSLKLMTDNKAKRRPLDMTPSLRPVSSTPDSELGRDVIDKALLAQRSREDDKNFALESPRSPETHDGDSIDGPSFYQYPSDDDHEYLQVDHYQALLDDSIHMPSAQVRGESDDSPTEDSSAALVARKRSLSSISAAPLLKDDEDDMPVEWNIISGVAGETPERDYPQAFNRDLRDIQAMVGERTSIMKTLTSLWTGNAANFAPLQCPLAPTEHIFPDSNVVVREDEPSSIIAFTLDSKHYKEKLHGMRHGVDASENVSVAEPNARVVVEVDDHYGDMEETLLRGTGTHIRYQFWDGPTRMNCKIFFAEQFEALRRNCSIDDKFVQSLARCMRWDVLGGKSGSTFLKSQDDRLIIKQLSRLEVDALYKFAPAYFEYMSQAIFHELPTVLAKIFGFYRISYKNPTTGRSMRFDCLVMENLFYERQISRIFDLKGSMRNRHVQSTGRQNEVLLDENLVEFIYESPLFIREHSKKLLRASVWNDTLFLSKLNVMDYSLLVGIDAERSELVVGIVDFIRTFTWDKKLESWVKESAFLGGGGKEPTIVSPRQYKNRFREAMERYFLMVPDKNISKSPGTTYIDA
ncbi:1-phosphatidylinositol-3-phosphate 5-kinase [Geranomyces michiganensis]|nr:1-phosphatidylinositol-3-phosphate 5-kinase [Geranomyces michiganensis]